MHSCMCNFQNGVVVKLIETERNLIRFLDNHFNFRERKEYFQRNTPYSLEIEVTDSCNSSCIYCYNSSITRKKPFFLEIEKAKDLIDSAVNIGIKVIWWLGGEPLLNRNLFDFLEYAKKKGIKKNVVFTNGILLNNNHICSRIVDLVDVIVFHLDTTKDSYYDLQFSESRVRYKNVIDGIINLITCGFDPQKVRHNITLNKISYMDLNSTLNWAINTMNFGMATLIPMFSSGRGLEVDKRLFLSKDEIQKSFILRAEIEKRPELMWLGPSEYCKQYQLTTCFISSKGDVTPYAGIDIVTGNIYKTCLENIIEDHHDILLFKSTQKRDGTNNLVGSCGNCKNSKYCFGTRTVSYRDGEGIDYSDPTCWNV